MVRVKAKRRGARTCCEAGVCLLATGCASGHAAPCVLVENIHVEKLAFCDALEALADSLPGRVDRMECLRIAERLVPAMRESHEFEESRIFPLYAESAKDPHGAETIARLKSEHIDDECAAADLTEELLRIGHGGAVENAEALGFMLRALFQTMRRHIAFEREHILRSIR